MVYMNESCCKLLIKLKREEIYADIMRYDFLSDIMGYTNESKICGGLIVSQ